MRDRQRCGPGGAQGSPRLPCNRCGTPQERHAVIPVLAFGRVLYIALVYGFAQVIALPAGFVAAASLLSGWPGVVLMAVVIPPVARAGRRSTRR